MQQKDEQAELVRRLLRWQLRGGAPKESGRGRVPHRFKKWGELDWLMGCIRGVRERGESRKPPRF